MKWGPLIYTGRENRRWVWGGRSKDKSGGCGRSYWYMCVSRMGRTNTIKALIEYWSLPFC